MRRRSLFGWLLSLVTFRHVAASVRREKRETLLIYRSLQIGQDSAGNITKAGSGWSGWSSSEGNDLAAFEYSARLHRQWCPPDNFARRYHPEWVKTRYLFEVVEVKPTGQTVNIYDGFTPEALS